MFEKLRADNGPNSSIRHAGLIKSVLNSFIGQDYDLCRPGHPRLVQVSSDFWGKPKIEGPLHSVRFTHRR